MSQYRPIACSQHDYLELACCFHYPLRVELKNQPDCHGIALTTQTHADKSEWLLLDSNGTEQAIRLDWILAITPQIHGASFGRIPIADQSENPACERQRYARHA
jgi:Rho-binding antiterminator